ncbi:hypothetical protein COU88_00555 [Candidatus Roizmanbacteria bacterium CG10_big_fil_rev_8_21_14_0_10_39_6]|uniref:Glycosyltransferase RgtA/B/C/D-like domain-containing protein n=1 Tax=Candidatus Roizmanbacteria bacterium CG10_big_fil_rev_8_21_14_0_10_39_6 TaxID=1974853 RepID=A0A2M8KTK3_9BACT|nr:MAG: hypothetical protein COU88_00555 [Candidatus Roizmanbacteria bacterium CG10_big_fil_rev_8_21_14_0_10_39_6]
MNKKILHVILLVGIVLNACIATIILFKQNIVYYPDVARDFLLLREIITVNPIMLIGERTGISGIYHGPLWLYLNVPAFILGRGNPVFMGWFWFSLYCVLVYIVYWVTKKMYTTTVGLLAAFLVSGMYAYHVPFMYNPHGALLMMPLFFYYFVAFVRKHTTKLAFLSFFFLGLIFQFEMAFAIPILFLSCIICLVTAIKVKNYKLIPFAFLGMLPGLSTFILFDITHGFLQSKGFLTFLFHAGSERPLLTYTGFLITRLNLALTDGLYDFTGGSIVLAVLVLLIIIWYFLKGKKQTNIYSALKVSCIFYVGFWLITLAYGGMMWPFYHWPIALMAIIVFTGIVTSNTNKYIWMAAIPFVIVVLMRQVQTAHDAYLFSDTSPNSWKLYRTIGENTLKQAGKENGYFVFNTDLVGYTVRYAMEYAAKKYNVEVHYNTKKKYTFLIALPVSDPSLDFNWWRKNMVRITKRPQNITKYPQAIRVYQYVLTNEEQNLAADSSLTNNLLFR